MFITFEGPEGAGKSSVIKVLAAELRAQGHDVTTTREPGAGEVGMKIREILLHGGDIDAKTELMLYLADRAEHVAKVIRPALKVGKIVLCDRYTDSTVAYQGSGREFSVTQIRAFNRFVSGDLNPDLTFLLDIEPSLGLARIKDKDRLDREPLAFHERVRTCFLHEAENSPDRWFVIDAAQPLDEVVAQCFEVVRSRMSS